MNDLNKLIKFFEKFPGIGARQAKRFAFYILTLSNADVNELSRLINSLASSVMECTSCRRFFSKNGGSLTTCTLCSDQNRDRQKLMVVERDSDIDAIERSGVYDGLYFVLGGTLPLYSIDDKGSNRLRSNGLKHIVKERIEVGLKEMILGFAVNPDGENTSRYIENLFSDLTSKSKLKISYLGRGLSTGSELEYADPETIKNALVNRH